MAQLATCFCLFLALAFSELHSVTAQKSTLHGYCCENTKINFLGSDKLWKHSMLFRFKTDSGMLFAYDFCQNCTFRKSTDCKTQLSLFCAIFQTSWKWHKPVNSMLMETQASLKYCHAKPCSTQGKITTVFGFSLISGCLKILLLLTCVNYCKASYIFF